MSHMKQNYKLSLLLLELEDPGSSALSHLVHIGLNKFEGLWRNVYTGFNAFYLPIKEFITYVITDRQP